VSRMARAVGAVVGATLVVAIAGLSRLPVGMDGADHGVVRLSWRLQGVRIETCRQRTEEELEALPAHMRLPEECTGRIAEYELNVSVDGLAAIHDTVLPSGARHDRPLYVLRNVAVEPGPHDVAIRFDALLPEGFDGAEGQTTAYAWTGVVDLAEAEIALVTLDEGSHSLIRIESAR